MHTASLFDETGGDEEAEYEGQPVYVFPNSLLNSRQAGARRAQLPGMIDLVGIVGFVPLRGYLSILLP